MKFKLKEVVYYYYLERGSIFIVVLDWEHGYGNRELFFKLLNLLRKIVAIELYNE